jgi:hypothetical protein
VTVHFSQQCAWAGCMVSQICAEVGVFEEDRSDEDEAFQALL